MKTTKRNSPCDEKENTQGSLAQVFQDTSRKYKMIKETGDLLKKQLKAQKEQKQRIPSQVQATQTIVPIDNSKDAIQTLKKRQSSTKSFKPEPSKIQKQKEVEEALQALNQATQETLVSPLTHNWRMESEREGLRKGKNKSLDYGNLRTANKAQILKRDLSKSTIPDNKSNNQSQPRKKPATSVKRRPTQETLQRAQEQKLLKIREKLLSSMKDMNFSVVLDIKNVKNPSKGCIKAARCLCMILKAIKGEMKIISTLLDQKDSEMKEWQTIKNFLTVNQNSVVSNFCKLKSFIDKGNYEMEKVKSIQKEFFTSEEGKVFDSCPQLGSKEYKPLYSYCFNVVQYACQKKLKIETTQSIKISPRKSTTSKHTKLNSTFSKSQNPKNSKNSKKINISPSLIPPKTKREIPKPTSYQKLTQSKKTKQHFLSTISTEHKSDSFSIGNIKQNKSTLSSSSTAKIASTTKKGKKFGTYRHPSMQINNSGIKLHSKPFPSVLKTQKASFSANKSYQRSEKFDSYQDINEKKDISMVDQSEISEQIDQLNQEQVPEPQAFLSKPMQMTSLSNGEPETINVQDSFRNENHMLTFQQQQPGNYDLPMQIDVQLNMFQGESQWQNSSYEKQAPASTSISLNKTIDTHSKTKSINVKSLVQRAREQEEKKVQEEPKSPIEQKKEIIERLKEQRKQSGRRKTSVQLEEQTNEMIKSLQQKIFRQ